MDKILQQKGKNGKNNNKNKSKVKTKMNECFFPSSSSSSISGLLLGSYLAISKRFYDDDPYRILELFFFFLFLLFLFLFFLSVHWIQNPNTHTHDMKKIIIKPIGDEKKTNSVHLFFFCFFCGVSGYHFSLYPRIFFFFFIKFV